MGLATLALDLSPALAAAIAAVPAIIAARSARQTSKHTATTNGRNLGELVEGLDRRLHRVERKLETPSGDAIGEVAERTHDLAAVAVAKNVQDQRRG